MNKLKRMEFEKMKDNFNILKDISFTYPNEYKHMYKSKLGEVGFYYEDIKYGLQVLID